MRVSEVGHSPYLPEHLRTDPLSISIRDFVHSKTEVERITNQWIPAVNLVKPDIKRLSEDGSGFHSGVHVEARAESACSHYRVWTHAVCRYFWETSKDVALRQGSPCWSRKSKSNSSFCVTPRGSITRFLTLDSSPSLLFVPLWMYHV